MCCERRRKNLKRIAALVLVLAWAAVSAQAGVVQPVETALYDLFPKQQQGENGIYLQYLSPDGSYTDLVCIGDYVFGTPGTPWNLPAVYRSPYYSESLLAHPTAVTQCGADRDPVIRVTLDGGYGSVRVTGSAQTASWGDVRYYIYKGAANYSQPIWNAQGGGSFDLSIGYSDGEELFFATDACGADYNDWANWCSVRFQAVPEPSSFAALGASLCAVLVRRRRSR